MDNTVNCDINGIAMPSLPSHSRKPWDTYALTITAPAGVGSAFVGTAAVGGSVLRDAGSVQGPPRVPR